jgi:hypothetical protein
MALDQGPAGIRKVYQKGSGKISVPVRIRHGDILQILPAEVEVDPGALGQVAVVMDHPGGNDQKVAPLHVKEAPFYKKAAAALLHVEDLIIIMKVIDGHLIVRGPGDPVDIDPVDVQIRRPHTILPAGFSGSKNYFFLHGIRKRNVCLQRNVKTGQKISGIPLLRARI